MAETQKVVVFRVGKEEYAIPIQFVISIEKIEGITPIPHLPHYVNGVAKAREELIPVIDLQAILYNKHTADGGTARMIILMAEGFAFGMIVSEAKEILDIESERMKQIGLMAYQKTAYFSGVANLNGRLVTTINPVELVSTIEGMKEIKEYMRSQQQT